GAGRIPGDEGRGPGQGDGDQSRRLGTELRQEQVEADLVEAVGLLNDLSRADVLVDHVDEFFQCVTRRPGAGQLQVVRPARLGFDDQVEHHVASPLISVLGRGLVEGADVRGYRHRWNGRQDPYRGRCRGGPRI